MALDKNILTIAVFCAFGRPALPDPEQRLLSAFTESIRRVYRSDARLVLLTDNQLISHHYHTYFNEVRAYKIDTAALLLERCRIYHDTLQRHDWATPIAFLDYDILVLKQFNELFTQDADVFLTTRSYSRAMPINGGVILVNNVRPARGISFYESLVHAYEGLEVEHRQWWGDQLSLAKVVLENSKTLATGEIEVQCGAIASCISKDIYNYTPYDVDSNKAIPKVIDENTLQRLDNEVFIAHFKGPRKHLMLSYADRLARRGDL